MEAIASQAPVPGLEAPAFAPDAASRAWLEELRAQGPARDAAIGRLHALLLRAARFEVARRRRVTPHLRDLDDVAQQAADDAVVSVLARLDDFRGDSRFTTWAYKFALLEAAVKVRRLAWQGREIPPLDPDGLSRLADRGPAAQSRLERRELLAAIRAAIEQALTPHQREVFSLLALQEVPIDVLAQRLGTTRGALYKTLHDARRKLRAELGRRGFSLTDGEEDG